MTFYYPGAAPSVDICISQWFHSELLCYYTSAMVVVALQSEWGETYIVCEHEVQHCHRRGKTAVFAPSAFWSDFCTFIATTFNNEESRLNTPFVWDCENLLQPCSRLYLQHSLQLFFFSMCLLDLYLHLPRLSLDWRPRWNSYPRTKTATPNSILWFFRSFCLLSANQ